MIKRLYVDRSVIHFPQVKHIEAKLKKVTARVVDSDKEVQQALTSEKDPIEAGKETLYLTKNRGRFLKACPGTRSYLCCGYHILHTATYCTMDCSYCILQSYFDPPYLQYFVNVDDLYTEIDRFFHNPHTSLHRVGTGEFTDSLLWETWSGSTVPLIRQFATQNRIVLELKTKTVGVLGLKDVFHNQKTIISWSLNPPQIIKQEERGTASLSSRLEAAAQCESWGYPLAFHFDPLILCDGWEGHYESTVNRVFDTIHAESIVWISLGSFRFMPRLKGIVKRRFPSSKMIYGEFIRGLDGKMRYFKPLRIVLYRKMVEWIRKRAPHVCLYFCMEDEEVWEKALGFVPNAPDGLSKMLDEAAAEHCKIHV